MKKKSLKIVLVGLVVFLLLLFPFSIRDNGYHAVLWSYTREKIAVQENIQGNEGLTEWYSRFRIRIFCFSFTVENPEDTRVGQW